MPRFLTSFLLSIPLSLGLPYLCFGLTFKLTDCTGGMFCLPLGLDFFPFLGLLLFGLPLFASFILLSFVSGSLGLDKRLEDASFVAQPAWPFSGFTMVVRLTIY